MEVKTYAAKHHPPPKKKPQTQTNKQTPSTTVWQKPKSLVQVISCWPSKTQTYIHLFKVKFVTRTQNTAQNCYIFWCYLTLLVRYIYQPHISSPFSETSRFNPQLQRNLSCHCNSLKHPHDLQVSTCSHLWATAKLLMKEMRDRQRRYNCKN